MTTVDFKAEVEKRRDEIMADLYSLLEINSERDDSKADAEHPFGPGPVKLLKNSWKLPNVMAMKPRMSTIMPVTLPLVKEKKSLGSLPIWTSCLQVVAGRQIHINQKLSMASSMRVVRLMIKGLQWPATMV